MNRIAIGSSTLASSMALHRLGSVETAPFLRGMECHRNPQTASPGPSAFSHWDLQFASPSYYHRHVSTRKRSVLASMPKPSSTNVIILRVLSVLGLGVWFSKATGKSPTTRPSCPVFGRDARLFRVTTPDSPLHGTVLLGGYSERGQGALPDTITNVRQRNKEGSGARTRPCGRRRHGRRLSQLTRLSPVGSRFLMPGDVWEPNDMGTEPTVAPFFPGASGISQGLGTLPVHTSDRVTPNRPTA
jgi:hypothetical protein